MRWICWSIAILICLGFWMLVVEGTMMAVKKVRESYIKPTPIPVAVTSRPTLTVTEAGEFALTTNGQCNQYDFSNIEAQLKGE